MDYMYKERERHEDLPTEEELEEDLIFLSYAAQEGVPFKDVFSGLLLEVGPYCFDKYYEDRTEQQFYMLAGLLYDSKPSDDLELESQMLLDGLRQYRNRFIDDPEVIMDIEGHEAVVAMNSGGLADFFAFIHAEYLEEAMDEFQNGELSKGTVTNLALWSKIDKIANRAVDIYDEDLAE